MLCRVGGGPESMPNWDRIHRHAADHAFNWQLERSPEVVRLKTQADMMQRQRNKAAKDSARAVEHAEAVDRQLRDHLESIMGIGR